MFQKPRCTCAGGFFVRGTAGMERPGSASARRRQGSARLARRACRGDGRARRGVGVARQRHGGRGDGGGAAAWPGEGKARRAWRGDGRAGRRLGDGRAAAWSGLARRARPGKAWRRFGKARRARRAGIIERVRCHADGWHWATQIRKRQSAKPNMDERITNENSYPRTRNQSHPDAQPSNGRPRV